MIYGTVNYKLRISRKTDMVPCCGWRDMAVYYSAADVCIHYFSFGPKSDI